MTLPETIAEIEALLEKADPTPWNVVPMCSIGSTHQWVPPNEAALIVALVNSAPALLAEIARLRKVEAAARVVATDSARFNDADRCYLCNARWQRTPPHGHDENCEWLAIDAALEVPDENA